MPTTNHGTTLKTDQAVIEEALTLIEPDGGWTQRAYCRDIDGYEVQPVVGSRGEWVRVSTQHVGGGGYRVHTERGATPCSFCLEGAVRAAAGYWDTDQPHPVHSQVDRLESLLLELANSTAPYGYSDLHAYNDDPRTTHADVVLLLKRSVAHIDDQQMEQT
ncbi:hypothetical protein M4D79_04570 [Mycolicibacterium novocastrense]|nr:hypothetical protein M4D79_04570 [Mycolicibacterium novocastrense]